MITFKDKANIWGYAILFLVVDKSHNKLNNALFHLLPHLSWFPYPELPSLGQLVKTLQTVQDLDLLNTADQ